MDDDISGVLAVAAIGFGFVVSIFVLGQRYESIWLDAFASSLLTPFYIVVAAMGQSVTIVCAKFYKEFGPRL